MDYTNLEVDFIERTIKTINQYNTFLKQNSEEESFDVTIYINSLTGLIILPKEKGFLDMYLPNERIETWGLRSSVKDESIKTIKQLAKQLRHCIAHFDVEFGSTNEKVIDKVIFKDTAEQKGVIAEFSINDFKIFVELLAEILVTNAKKRNNN